MKKNTLYIIAILCTLCTFSQEKPSYKYNDSLFNLIRKSEELRVANKMYESLEYAFKAVDYGIELKNDHYISHGYFLMGTVQYEIIDYENATKNYLKALEYTEKTKDKLLLPYILHSLGNIYYDGNNDFESALDYYKRAVQLVKKSSHIEQYQVPLHNLIWTYMDLDRYDEASLYLKEADSIDSSIPDSVLVDRSSLYLLRARSYAHQGNIARAEEYFDKSFEYLQDESYWPKGKSYFYQYRAEMYENIGDYPRALADLKLLQANERKVFENARSKGNETVTFRSKVDRYEKKLALAQREKDLLVDLDKNNKLIIFISTAALLLLAVAFFFYYRGYQSKKKVTEILEIKNSELYEAKSQAEKLSKIKSQFISTISHELRTPLYGVVGISSILLENEKQSDKDKKLLNSLKFSADYLLDLVNNVLKVSKIDSEEKELIKTPTDVHSLTQNILQSFEYQAQKKGNELILKFNPSIPKLLNIDALRTSEVLINLLGNAIKFTEQGKIWLRIKLISKDGSKVILRFEVEDTGMGVPEDQKEYIFEEFSQIGSVYDNKQGTGLGLSIVKNLIEVMGSQIYFESKKGVGSMFYFELDTDIPESLEIPDKDEESSEQDSISANILVAEDNKINQLVTKNLLKNIGCECTIVANGIEAVQAVKKDTFDLVLMDINMPVMDGMRATIEIREFNTSIPIIALTASELSEVSDDCKKAGMNDLINKPLNKKDLQYAIERNITINST